MNIATQGTTVSASNDVWSGASMIAPSCDAGQGKAGSFVSTTFSIATLPRTATLRISALGLYRAFINGQRVGNDLVTLPNLVAGQGALPIKVGDDVIGAAGASGAPGGEKDEACIQAGLDKIKDKLN